MRENVTELFSCVCRKETTPEDAANLVADQALEYFTAKVPVGGFLAEHLLLPMALAGEGNFRTLPPSEKVRTAAKTIQLFTGHDFEFASEAGQAWRVSLG
jgi:RNA 3'-terminal phosphate cyclase (ATP)